MDMLSPYLNLTSTTQVKVKTVLKHPAEKEGLGAQESLKTSVLLRANKQACEVMAHLGLWLNFQT